MTSEPVSLGQGIHRITLPLPLPSPRAINCYVLEGADGLTVIDCGVDDPERLDELLDGIEDLLGGTAPIERLICTHLHPDHMGGAHTLLGEHTQELIMHELTPSHLAGYNDWTIRQREVAALAAEHGADEDDLALLRASWPRPSWAGTGVPPTRSVGDGDRITIGAGRSLEVLHTPGHHPTHICLQDSRTGQVFSGDHILPRITPFIPYDEARDSLAEYFEGLERLERIDPGTTHPAHGVTVEEGRARARQIALHHESRLGAMQQVTKGGGATAWHVMTEVFRPDLSPAEKYLAFQETLAHLEHLVNRGRLQRTKDDGIWIYGR